LEKEVSNLSQTRRRDAILPNRVLNPEEPWGFFRKELDAKYILFEYKNFKTAKLGKEEVSQVRNYLTEPMGKFAIIVCTKEPEIDAKIERNIIYGNDRIVILFLTTEDLIEMLEMKRKKDDPAEFLIEKYDEFVYQYE
jgi:hypothetical protein